MILLLTSLIPSPKLLPLDKVDSTAYTEDHAVKTPLSSNINCCSTSEWIPDQNPSPSLNDFFTLLPWVEKIAGL
jgi:hypothetical protein